MSSANTAIAFRRTEAGADELTQPSLGLSVSQRKMLRCCGTATSIDEIERLFAAEEAHYSRERFDRDLEKLEQFGLIQRTGAALKIVHTRPSTINIDLPAQTGPAPVRAINLRSVSTAQPQPRRLFGALIGAGVVVAGTAAFWLWPADRQAVQPATSAVQPEYSAPVFIDEPAAPTLASRPAPSPRKTVTVKNSKDAAQPTPGIVKPAAHSAPARVVASPSIAPPAPQAAPAVLPVARAPESRLVQALPATEMPVLSARVAPSLATTPPSQPVVTVVAPAVVQPSTLPLAVPTTTAAVSPPAPQAQPAAPLVADKKAAVRLKYREKAEFPTEASLGDIRKGSVRARLNIDENGNVSEVQILSAQGGRIFNRPAIAALKKWRYEATGQRESAIAEIEFSENN